MKDTIIEVISGSEKITIDTNFYTNCLHKNRTIVRIEDESEFTDTHFFTQYTGYNVFGDPILSFQNCPVIIKHERYKESK